MAKTKQEKQDLIEKFRENLKKQKSAIFVSFDGVDSKSLTELREKLKKSEAGFNVAKKKLFAKALEAQGDKDSAEKVLQMEGSLGVAFGFGDEVTPAKFCYDFAQENENLKILGGIVNGEFSSKDKIIELAKLPPKQELLARLVGSLNSPIYGFMNALSGNMRNLLNVITAISKAKA